MAYKKITGYGGRDVASAPDVLTGTASENKAVFDRAVKEVVAAAVNELIDDLTEKDNENEARFSTFVEKSEMDAYEKSEDLSKKLDNYATKDELSQKADASELTNYATRDEVSTKIDKKELAAYATKDALASKAEKSELTGFASKKELESKAERSELAGFADREELKNYATKDSLSTFVEKSELDAYEKSEDLSKKLASYAKKDEIPVASGADFKEIDVIREKNDIKIPFKKEDGSCYREMLICWQGDIWGYEDEFEMLCTLYMNKDDAIDLRAPVATVWRIKIDRETLYDMTARLEFIQAADKVLISSVIRDDNLSFGAEPLQVRSDAGGYPERWDGKKYEPADCLYLTAEYDADIDASPYREITVYAR